MYHPPFTRSYKRLYKYLPQFMIALCCIALLAGCGEKNAEDHYQESITFAASNDTNAAVVALKNALQLEPRLAKARFMLGNIYLEIGSFDAASKELTFALDYGYPKDKILPSLAKALHRAKANVALADLEYKNASLSASDEVEVGYRKAQAMMTLNQQAESTKLINELLLIDASSTYKEMLKGLQLAIQLDNIEALNTVKAALVKDPVNRDAIDLSARLYLLNNDPDNAVKQYEEYIKVAPEDLEAQFSIANMLIQLEKPENAEKYVDGLLAINANNAAVNQLKAVIRASAKDYSAAKVFAEKAINSGSNNFTSRMVAGLSSYELADYESAVRHLTVISDQLPDNHSAKRMLAASQLEVDMDDDAGEILSRVTDISSKDSALLTKASVELVKTGNTDAAIEIIEKSGSLNMTPDELVTMALLKLTVDDDSGINDLENIVKTTPQSDAAKEALGGAYLAANQLYKAQAFARSWQLQDPTNIEPYILESEALQREKKYTQAGVLLQKASTIAPQNLAVKLAAIRLAIRQDKFQDALVMAESFLAQHPTDVTALASYFQIKLKLGDPLAAVSKIEAAALQNVDDEPLVLLAASTMLSTNKFTQALDLLSNVTPSRLTPRSYWELKGTALINTNQLTDAHAHYTKWSTLLPKQTYPIMGLLRVLDAQGDYPKAAKIAGDFLAQKDDSQLRLMQAYYLSLSQDAKGAKRIINMLDRKTQDIPFARGIKARIALIENRGDEVIADAKVAYEANKNPNNLLVYVLALDSAGKSDTAFQIIEAHMQVLPNDLRSKALLAERQVSRDPALALATYKEIVASLPNNPVVLNNTGYLLLKENKLEEALKYSSKAFSISPTNIDFADTYAQVRMRRNEAAQAVAAYNKAIGPTVRDEGIILNYIESMLVSKDITGARRKIQEFNSKIRSPQGKSRLLVLQSTYLQ